MHVTFVRWHFDSMRFLIVTALKVLFLVLFVCPAKAPVAFELEHLGGSIRTLYEPDVI